MSSRRQALLSLILFSSLLASSLVSLISFPNASAQSNATPVAGDAAPLFTSRDIDSRMLGSTSAATLAIENPHLILERITLGQNVKLPARSTISPEVLFVESGAISIEDSFGFATETGEGQTLTFNPDSTYELTNSGSQDAVVYRLSISGTSNAVASPAAGAAAATPVVGMMETVILIDREVQDLPTGDSTLFIADATFAPGTMSGEYAHTGPLGIYVKSGTLSVLSPSGVTGQLKENAGVVLPTNAPFVASNASDSDVSVLLVGIAGTDAPILAEVTPIPTPTIEPTATTAPTPTIAPTNTPIPTPTVAPTNTPIPTPTTAPTSTPKPSPTPEPSPTPAPTAIPVTKEGTILQLGQTWQTENALLTLSGEPEYYGVLIKLVYQNTSSSRIDVAIPSGVINTYDDQRESWKVYDNKLAGDRLILDPGESRAYQLGFNKPSGDSYSANVFIAITGLSDVSSAKWGFTFDKGRILTIPPNAVDPTSGVTSDKNQTASNDAPAAATTGKTVDIQAILPSTSDIPDGLSELSISSRSLDEVTSKYPDPADASAQFTAWGWQANSICNFGPIPASAWEEGKLNGVYVSIHQFDSPDHAAAGLDYSLTAQATGTPLQEIATQNYGDYTRALYGVLDYGNEVTFLVQKGNLFVRISAASVGADPTSKAAAILQTILAKA